MAQALVMVILMSGKKYYKHVGGGCGISNKKCPCDDEPRAFSVRKVNLRTGDIDTVGEVGEYKSLERARVAMKRKCQ
jgi:hypothetical protein